MRLLNLGVRLFTEYLVVVTVMDSNGRRQTLIIFFSCLIFFFMQPFSYNAAETDTIRPGDQLRDYDHLVSAGGIFKLGFFTAGNSRSRYLGIWYNYDPDQMVVWVANRNTPISDSTGFLTIDAGDGKLKINYNGGNPIVLNSHQSAAGNATATLLDSGNFVLRGETNSNRTSVLWQSFDYLTDTLLPGMKLGMNLKSGQNWSLTCWTSDNVPAPGGFVLGLDPNSKRQLMLWRRGEVYWTSGIWGKIPEGFALYPFQTLNYGYNFSYISTKDEIYFTYSVKNLSLPMLFVSFWGKIVQDSGGTLGPFGGSCDGTDPGCVEEEKNPECRSSNDWFELHVGSMTSGEPFMYEGDSTLTIDDCYSRCWANCSCVAYATANRNATGCRLWGRELTFVSSPNGDDVRLLVHGGTRKRWWIWFFIGVSIFLVILLFISLCYYIQRKFRLKGEWETSQEKVLLELGMDITPLSQFNNINELSKDDMEDHDLKVFEFSSIAAATNNFSDENKLGKGGFGPVYKGKLVDECEIAVKRLSSSSRQGLMEFKTEIKLIAKIQHMNLVRLLGCCIHGEEKMLIYEYMSNKSLDFFIFDPIKGQQLDWNKRLNIIEGIAQGLLYLHKYSRLKIIHRDLKSGNILLDNDMNPKISDFGLARIFGHNETEANTNRRVGTWGYMSPEYAMEGIFSEKSDVFSFGVLLLEIVSGRKSTNICYYSEEPLNLVGYAWMLWKDDKGLELVDPTLAISCPKQEVMKHIHVGLLCVQAKAMDRPSMLDIVSMISDKNIQFSPPKQPAFCTGRSTEEVDPSNQTSTSFTVLKILRQNLDKRS